MFYAVNGLGSMLGFALGGILPKPDIRRLGLVMFGADLLAGLAIVWLGQAERFVTAAPALAQIGVAASYGGVLGLSWIQRRIPPSLAGRILSIVMFAVLGLTPISMTAAGFLVAHYSLAVLLSGAGSVIVSVALLGIATPATRRFAALPAPVTD